MTFDVPLLLFLAPVLGLGLGFAAWLGRRRRIRLARRWSPALGRLARSRGAWGPLVIGIGWPRRRRGVGGSSLGPDGDPHRVARPQPRLRRGHQPVDARRRRGAQSVAAGDARIAAPDSGPRWRSARADRLRGPKLHPRPAHRGRQCHPDVPRRPGPRPGEPRRDQPRQRPVAGRRPPGRDDRRGGSGARRVHRRRGARHARPTSSGQRSRSRRRVSGSSWWRKAAPLPRAFRSATRPARWSSTSATTTGRSSRPSGATTCSARSWMQPRGHSSPARRRTRRARCAIWSRR